MAAAAEEDAPAAAARNPSHEPPGPAAPGPAEAPVAAAAHAAALAAEGIVGVVV